MMCGCEAKPAGGTMEKALRGGGCGHQFDFRNGNPLGEGKMGEPVNERQWKFIPRNQRANPDRYLIRMAEQRDRQQRDIAEQARRKNEEERVKREQAAKRKVKNAAAEKMLHDKTPVNFILREAVEVMAKVVKHMVTPMDLPHELDLLQLLQGGDKRNRCSNCQGSGKDTNRGAKVGERGGEKEQAPKAASSTLHLENEELLASIKAIYHDADMTRNTKVRKVMLLKNIDARLKQKIVSSILSGKELQLTSCPQQLNPEYENGGASSGAKRSAGAKFEDDYDLLHRAGSHSSSLATWLYMSNKGEFEIYDPKTNSVLEEAYASGGRGTIVQIQGPHSEYIIDLAELMQINVGTGEKVSILRVAGDENDNHTKHTEKNSRDARIMVLVRGASLEQEFEDSSGEEDNEFAIAEKEEPATWIFDLGGGNWDLFTNDSATLCERNCRENAMSLEIDLFNPKGRFKISFADMNMKRLPQHEGPPIAIRRLGDPIPEKKKVEQKPKAKVDKNAHANTRGRALKRRREKLLQSMTPTTGVSATVVYPTLSMKERRYACQVCRGTGKTSHYMTPRDCSAVARAMSVERDGKYDCLVCYGDGEFCLSEECGRHYYCGDCLRGSLEAILNTGQFPAFCPACRAESGANSAKPVNHGKIDEASLAFLQMRGVISVKLFNRFLSGAIRAQTAGGEVMANDGDGDNEGEVSIGMNNDDVRGTWRLIAKSWNLRSLPHSRAGSQVVRVLKKGYEVKVKRHIKKDWCLLSGPAEVKNRYIKLRSSSHRARSWEHIKKVKTGAKKLRDGKGKGGNETRDSKRSFECPGKCGAFLLSNHKSYVEKRMGEFYEQGDKIGLRLGECPQCNALICKRCTACVPSNDVCHVCPKAKLQKNDKATEQWMRKICKKCPGCGQYVQKTEGCDIMMCGTNAHGKVRDALRNGGCALIFSWKNLKECNDGHGYTGMDGKWHKGKGPVTDRQVLLRGKK